MTPFELNLRLPFSEDAWYATSATEWAQLFRGTTEVAEPVSFLPMLKKSWNPHSTKILTEALPRGASIIMYGLISIARELSHREDNSLSNRSSNSLVWLGHKTRRSFEMWEASWKKVPAPMGLKKFAWRDCLCVIRLAHTLYEISPVDLQTVAGKEIIEGKDGVLRIMRSPRGNYVCGRSTTVHHWGYPVSIANRRSIQASAVTHLCSQMRPL